MFNATVAGTTRKFFKSTCVKNSATGSRFDVNEVEWGHIGNTRVSRDINIFIPYSNMFSPHYKSLSELENFYLSCLAFFFTDFYFTIFFINLIIKYIPGTQVQIKSDDIPQ